jgi:hypothetical protein
MACGIIPASSPRFGTWDIPLKLNSGEQYPHPDLITQFLASLKVDDTAITAIQISTDHENTGHYWPAFVDVLGLWSDWVPCTGSFSNSVKSPIGHRIYTMSEVWEARVVWRWLLREREKRGNNTPVQSRVLHIYDCWEEAEPQRFYDYYKPSYHDKNYAESLAFWKRIYDETTNFFEQWRLETLPHFYRDLIGSHINVNAHSLRQAGEHVTAGTSRNDGRVGFNLWDTLFTERAFIYVDNIPKIIENMKVRGYSEESVEDTWWMLMLRGQCWEMSINRVVQHSIVPSSYYYSSTKVYIL